MKKWIFIILMVMTLTLLVVPASARTNAQQMEYKAIVGEDGGCNVTVVAEMHIDESVTEPVFAVPTDADEVKLNGHEVDTTVTERKQLVSLKQITGGVPGTYQITVTYRLKNPVQTQEGNTMLLTVPILSDFDYPVDALVVTVELPGEVENEPTFISAYYQKYTDKILKTQVSGNTVKVESLQRLLDTETLTMNLQVSDSMFPGTAAKARMLGMMDVAVIVAIVLALVYYALTMLPVIPSVFRRSSAPDGVSAGELAPWFIGGKTDLSLLVISWAQLGYLRIEVTDSGRVLLHKRMDMGNERSGFENRCYKNLFGRRRVLDAGSDHYARMVLMARKKGRNNKEVYKKKSGKPVIFRGLCVLAALLGGIVLAGALAPDSGFLRVVLAMMIAVFAIVIQLGTRGFDLRRKTGLLAAGVCSLIWFILGISAGQWLMTLLMIVFQFLSGVLANFGGKRTELGRQAVDHILGMRKFMRCTDKKELQRLLKANPGYFYEMAPYALALGVDRRFAARFERLRIGECSYLITEQGAMTAAQWAMLLRKTVNTMDAKANRTMPWQR